MFLFPTVSNYSIGKVIINLALPTLFNYGDILLLGYVISTVNKTHLGVKRSMAKTNRQATKRTIVRLCPRSN